MQPFIKHTGLVAPLDRANVDTDQIIPKQFLKRIERTGFGEFLFFDWRLRDDGSEDPDFELNRPEVAGASILLARRNFGCGSSREHAVWALAGSGFRSVIAPSFADIFFNNCFKNGVLPVQLDEAAVDDLFTRTARRSGCRLTIDLESCTVTDDDFSLDFQIDSYRRYCLMCGLDEIAATLQNADKIAQYEESRQMPAVP